MYEAGFLDERCTLLNRTAEVEDEQWGTVGGDYHEDGEVHCNWSPVKGKRIVSQGTLDVVGCVVVRMRYTPKVNNDTMLIHDHTRYRQTTPPIIMRRKNEIQLTVQEELTHNNSIPE